MRSPRAASNPRRRRPKTRTSPTWRFILVPVDQRHRLALRCELGSGEVPVCCINIGTATQRKPPQRLRPLPAQFVSVLAPAT
jgi:hypothetical protein